jgi:hypothetical protein
VKNKISFHPKLAAMIDAIINIALLWWLKDITSWWILSAWFGVRVFLWAIFVRLVYYPKEINRFRHFISLIFFSLGAILSLIIFVEWVWSWRILATAFALFSSISFWLLPQAEEANQLSFVVKPYRRWLFLMDAFGLAGFWGGIYAMLAFQIINQNYFWLCTLFGAGLSALVAGWWWKVYGLNYSKRYWFGLIVIFILIYELSFVIWYWPLGYLINAILMIWFWYNFWLIIRFNLTARGIEWKKQIVFFFFNIVLLILFLLLVRWK